jgi:ClpP class serine protease
MRWAITPQGLQAIWDIASKHTVADYEIFHRATEGEKQAVITDMGEKVKDSPNAFVKGDTGILLIDGPIIPRAGTWDVRSGYVGIKGITEDFKAFESDPRINRIVGMFDSPGGDITGVSEFSQLVASSKKETIAYVYGVAASAAYWIASGFDKIVGSDTSITGSIGTVAVFRLNKNENRIEIVSDQSPDKRPDLTTEDGRANIQQVLNELTDVFVGAVSANRGVSVKKVLSDFGQGGEVVAKRALKVGMIDKIMTLDALMSSFQPTPAQGGEQGGFKMDLNQFLAENPAAAVELKGRLAAEFERGKTEASKSNKARIESASKYLGTAYSAEIQQLAVKVICGKSNADALDMAVVVADSNKEQIASLQAQIETMATGSTSPGTEMSEIQKELAEDNAIRAEMGLAPLEMRS